MSLITSPMYFGIEDQVVVGAHPFGVRIYYPTDDDVILGAPLAPGPHPLVVFAHGQRSATDELCPTDNAQDYRRWTLVLGALARSGFVVAAPDLHDSIYSASGSAERLLATVNWMRAEWSGRRTLHRPSILDPGVTLAAATDDADGYVGQADDAAAKAERARPPIYLGPPTDIGLIGHSWGARACALVAALGEAKALAAVSGSFDSNESIAAIRAARIPTCLLCGTTDAQTFSYLVGLWSSLATPKYEVAFQAGEHWDWFGPEGAIRRCDGAPPGGRETAHIAGELLAGFMTRHLARVAFDPPHLVRIPLLRPWLVPWFRDDPAIRIRWETPEVQFDALPTTGDDVLGPWTEGSPW